MNAGWEAYEAELRGLLGQAYTPAGVDVAMGSRLEPPGSGLPHRTVRQQYQHFDAGDGRAVLDWAESQVGTVAT